jgi:hypothetical protein
MTLTEELIKVVEINNGLELKIFDASKLVASDRWQVCMIARMDIPVEYHPFFGGVDLDEFDAFQTSVGRTVRFEKKLVRNFIDEKAKDATLEHMINTLLTDSIAYLSHRDFPNKFVLKRFKEFMIKKTWK